MACLAWTAPLRPQAAARGFEGGSAVERSSGGPSRRFVAHPAAHQRTPRQCVGVGASGVRLARGPWP